MNIKQHVVILGHSGFIGSRLEQILSRDTAIDITGKSLPDIDLTDKESIEKLKPYLSSETTLILLAAVKRQFGDTLDVYRSNMTMIENLCCLLTDCPVKRIIYFSSAAVYGEETDNTEISESTLVNPTSYYGIAKYNSERLLNKSVIDHPSMSLVCLRPPLIYGPGDPAKTYGPSGFTAVASNQESITLWGDGKEYREFIYVDDVCEIVRFLIYNDFSGELNLVSGTRYTFADVIALLEERFTSLVVNQRERTKTKADNAFLANKIHALLPSDFCFTSLEQGIDNLITSYNNVS